MAPNDKLHETGYGLRPAGFRLSEATRVGRVRLQVSDLQRSLDYYQGVLGLQLFERSRDSATLGVAGDNRGLVRVEEKAGSRPVPRRGAFGLYHFAILLPDRAALGRFAAHLSRAGARVGMADHLVSEALYLTDPDGLGIEVYADRPRERWEHRGRELKMATDPLDIQSVVAAGGEREWSGAPEGTRMGHVHLHVGDLDRSEAFYHAALGFDKTVWSYPGALFLSAGGYHHHLATNTWSPGPSAAEDQSRLLDWELILPRQSDADAAGESIRAAGYAIENAAGAWTVADPWGTRLLIRGDSDRPVR